MIVLLASAFAQDPAVQAHLDQARHFLRKEWTADAIIELEAAVALPEGRLDPEAWYLLATSRLAVADVTGAREAAERALTNARTAGQADEAEELVRYLQGGFGELIVTSPVDGTVARVDMSLVSLVLDPRAQELAEVLRSQAHDKDTLPRRFTVPAGTWSVDGQEVDVAPNATVTVTARGPRGVGGLLDRAEIEVGLSLTGVQGADVPRHLPTGSLDLAIGWVLGPIELAAVGHFAPTPYQRRDGGTEAFPGGGVGLRLGVPIPGLAPWLVRPALTGRLAWVPGIELACTGADAFDCSRTGDADLLLYATGQAFAPGARLTVARIDRTLPFALGFGVDGVEWLSGSVPTSGTATLSDGREVPWTLVDGGWSALRWSGGVRLYIAL